MKKIKSVKIIYDDGTHETTDIDEDADVQVNITSKEVKPYNAADPESEHLGVVEGHAVLFPDGSFRDTGTLGSSCHMPHPLGGQYPRERYKHILRYWSAKLQLAIKEFDKLKKVLLRRDDSFQIDKDGCSIDAVARLKELQEEVEEIETSVKTAEKDLYDVSYHEPQPVLTLAQAEREEKFGKTVSGIEI